MTIDRAIKVLTEYLALDGDINSEYLEAQKVAIEALKAQKTGKWQKYEGRFDYDWKCSECGCSSYERTDWCANCGARMVGEEDG